MTEFLQQIEQFHFLRPLWLLAVIPVIIIVIMLWRRKAAYGSWQRVISPHLLTHLLTGNVSQQSKTPLLLLMVIWMLACIAMAGPTWKKLPQPAQKNIQAQVIILDLSLSMYSKDLPPSRLVRARMKLTDLLERTHEGLTALIVFAGTPHIVTPLTDDTNTILSMVNSLSPEIMPVKGSNPTAAIKLALDIFKQAGVDGGRILLMTDDLPANFSDEVGSIINGNTPLSIMGIGTAQGAPIEMPDGSFIKQSDGSIVIPRLDFDTLKYAARNLGGRFSTISTTDEDINYLMADELIIDNEKIKQTTREFDIWDESGHWIVLLILPFAAAGYRKGWLGAWLVPVLAPTILVLTPTPSYAFEWQDLWQTRNQQAQQQLQQGNPEAAAETFSDPAWKASSYYQAGNFEQAQPLFQTQQDADGFYNLGNTQAKQNQLQEAIESYDKALALNPGMEDAQFNRELVAKLMEQQNQQKGDDGEQQDSDQQENNDEKNQDDQQKQDQQDGQKNDEQQDSESDQQQKSDSSEDSEQEQENNQNQEQDQQDPSSSQPEEPSEDDMENDEENENFTQAEQTERTEDQQALEQWLRRVPDDPGGLLRRKFQQESQLRNNNAPKGETAW